MPNQPKPIYRRVLLKLSGEALMGERSFGIDPAIADQIAQEVAEVKAEVEETYSNTIPKVAELLLRDYVLAFEVASVLLLAAVIGSLVLVREP